MTNALTIDQGPGAFWIAMLSRAGLLPPDILAFPGFEKIERRATGNDALACPAARCAAPADFQTSAYAIPASELLARITAVALSDPRTIQLDMPHGDGERADFQQASAMLRFPDIISVRVFALGPAELTLAIWSRSVVGRKDFGVNRARIERWLKAL